MTDRAELQTVVKQVLPTQTGGGTYTATIQARGQGIEILRGAIPGIKLTFISKADGERVTPPTYEVGPREQGQLLSEDFDEIQVEWEVNPRDFPSAGLNRPLVVMIYSKIRSVPVRIGDQFGLGRLRCLTRGTVSVAAGGIGTIWNDDVVAAATAGLGDRWFEDQAATEFGRLVGYVTSDDGAHVNWAVVMAGMSQGPNDTVPPDYSVTPTWHGIYQWKPVLRAPLHTTGNFASVTFNARGRNTDEGASDTAANKAAGTDSVFVPPGGFRLDVYNNDAGAQDYHYALGVATGF